MKNGIEEACNDSAHLYDRICGALRRDAQSIRSYRGLVADLLIVLYGSPVLYEAEDGKGPWRLDLGNQWTQETVERVAEIVQSFILNERIELP